VFTESEGKLLSLASDYVDLEATAVANRRSPGAPPTVHALAPAAPQAPRETDRLPPGGVVDSPVSSASIPVIPPTTDLTEEPQDRNTTTERTAREALFLIGVNDLLDGIPEEALFQAGQLTTLWPGANGAEYASFRGTAKLAFATDAMRQVVAESFQRRAPEPSLKIGIDFLRSALWQRIRELEQAAQTPEGLREFQNFAVMLRNEPATQRQREIAERFDKALGMSRMQIDLRVEILTALVEGFRRLAPRELNATNEEAEKWIAETRARLATDAEAAALAIVLFSYRSLSDAELMECIEFWESHTGRALRRAAEESVLDGVRVGAARLNVLLAAHSRNGSTGLFARAER
jgi:hypothetical protein